MKWEDKHSMVKYWDEDHAKFKELVLKNLGEFDLQACAIFLTVISLKHEDLDSDIEFYDKVLGVIKNHKNVDDLGLKTLIRLEYLDNYINKN